MMCKHEFVKQKMTCNVDWCYGCNVCKPQIALESDLTAARAELAELRKDNERQKRLATISRLCKNVQSFRAEKAEAKILQMEDAIKFDTERFFEFQRRAEQAEAQCAAMREAFEQLSFTMARIEKESFKSVCYDHIRQYVERIMKPAFFKTAGSALLAELQRYRSLSASSSAQRVTAGEDAP